MWERDTGSSVTSHTGSLLEHSYDGVNSAPLEILRELVSSGHVIQSELLRLRTSLPEAVLQPQASRYAAVLPGFAHLQAAHLIESEITSDATLLALDEEFRLEHGGHVHEVFSALELILDYHQQLDRFLDNLGARAYVQTSLESLLLGADGKQLMVEAIARLAAILLMMDEVLPAEARERAVVAVYRLQGGAQAAGESFNALVTLVKGTGIAPGKSWPEGYPSRLLQRLPVSRAVVRTVISKMRSEDIYSNIAHYPSAEHRSTALSRQAAELYLLLLYDPELLQHDTAAMRELVDKHFADNWVVSWAPGFLADLPVQWAQYSAAASALNGIIAPSHVRSLATLAREAMRSVLVDVKELLREGVLSDGYVLCNVTQVFDIIRTANVILRWLLLHRSTKRRRLRAALALRPDDEDDLLTLLLLTAQLEVQVRGHYQGLLDTAAERWALSQQRVVSSLQELATFFSGEQPLSRDMADARLCVVFTDLAAYAADLRPLIGWNTIKGVRELMAQLDEVQQRHSVITSSLHTRHHTTTTRTLLSTMICLANIRKEMQSSLDVITDFSYGWAVIRELLPRIHERVRSQPSFVAIVGSLVVKLASLMAVPKARVSTASQIPVIQFYSAELAALLRAVLKVVPASLFRAVEQVVALQGSGMVAIPETFPRDQLSSYAQLPQRQSLAQLTYTISAYAQGLLTMERIVRNVATLPEPLAPFAWVHRGIKTHLSTCITAVCATTLCFPRRSPHFHPAAYLRADSRRRCPNSQANSPDLRDPAALMTALLRVRQKMLPLSAGLEYLQDYLSIGSLTMWHQAASEVWKTAIAAEVAALNAVSGSQSKTYILSRVDSGNASPSHVHTPAQHLSPAVLSNSPAWFGSVPRRTDFPVTFLGRTVLELLRLSNPCATMYDESACAWRSLKTGAVLLGDATFGATREAVGAEGLEGLDHLLQRRVILALAQCDAHLRSSSDNSPVQGMQSSKGVSALLSDVLSSEAYRTSLSPFAQVVSTIGQSQLLRRHIAIQTAVCANSTATPAMSHVIEALDTATLRSHQRGLAALANQHATAKFSHEVVVVDDLTAFSHDKTHDALELCQDALTDSPAASSSTAFAPPIEQASKAASAAGRARPLRQMLSIQSQSGDIASALVCMSVSMITASFEKSRGCSVFDSHAMAAGIRTVLMHAPTDAAGIFFKLIGSCLAHVLAEEAAAVAVEEFCNEYIPAVRVATVQSLQRLCWLTVADSPSWARLLTQCISCHNLLLEE